MCRNAIIKVFLELLEEAHDNGKRSDNHRVQTQSVLDPPGNAFASQFD